MSKLKCPFCKQKLDYDDLLCSCINEYCEESFDMVGTELLWQKVIDLKQELADTKKKLDIAVDALDRMAIYDSIYDIIARNAMKRIKELEQKDVK